MLQYDDESGDSHTEVWLEVFWRVGGDEYDNYWFQNYLEMEDPTNEGMFMSVTCSVEYDSSNDYAQDIRLKNYYSTDSIRTEAGNINGKSLDQLTTEAPEAVKWFQKDLTETMQDNYRTITGRSGYQSCAVRHLMWAETNGQADDIQLNRAYWQGLGQDSQNFYTGFRIYPSLTSSNFIRAADARPTAYKMHDFGLKQVSEIDQKVSSNEIKKNAIALVMSVAFSILLINLI